MLEPVCSLDLLITEEDLRKLTLVREDDIFYDEDTIQSVCDSVEMTDDDITLAICLCGDTMYEISTTCDRHNLYLFKNEMVSDTDYQTVDATNISCELDEIRTYHDLLRYIVRRI